MKKLGFTLAEIMIVLSVIGILTAILLPVAHQITPDENVIKFKKAHNTLGTVIRELVTSDRYYKDGDLGTRADGTLIDGTHDGDYTYLCATFADVLNIKSVNCSKEKGKHGSLMLRTTWNSWHILPPEEITQTILDTGKAQLDTACASEETINVINAEITTLDGVVFYQGNPQRTYGHTLKYSGENNNERFRPFSSPNETPKIKDINGMDIAYKYFCMDIDGIGVGEDPFGYGIRADGKILNGARADEWLKKSIQGD